MTSYWVCPCARGFVYLSFVNKQSLRVFFGKFQEYWCKRLHPKNVCEKVYRQPHLRDSLKKGKLKKQDFAVTKQKTALVLAADLIGKKIQYDCPGFLPNKRQVIHLLQWLQYFCSSCGFLLFFGYSVFSPLYLFK